MNNKPTDVRVRVPERKQMAMMVSCADDLVPANHPVRLIWDVVGRLDLAAFYAPIRARTGVVGRDATDPRLLVALWLYGATRGVGSARELARRCTESRPYQWLCGGGCAFPGGVSLNHHTLSDFRVGHAAALDALFTAVIASLLDKGVIKVHRISQDGTRVRACAGASSFRREQRLNELLEQAKVHVAELKTLLDDPAKSAGLSAKQRAARVRAARRRQARVEQAIAQLPELNARQERLKKRVSKKDQANGKLKEPRASTTDADARVMKMPDGGFRPAVNVQLATDTHSRAIVGVTVVNAGVDTAQAEPMRNQVEDRTKRKVHEHLLDGGYLVHDEIERAHDQRVTLYVPPKPPRNTDQRGSEYEPRPEDSDVLRDWRARMGSDDGKAIYKERAATSETANADLKTHRGLVQLTVRGLAKATCVALWSALAYNLMHFGPSLLS